MYLEFNQQNQNTTQSFFFFFPVFTTKTRIVKISALVSDNFLHVISSIYYRSYIFFFIGVSIYNIMGRGLFDAKPGASNTHRRTSAERFRTEMQLWCKTK